MRQHINAVIERVDALRAATNLVLDQADLPACDAFVTVLDELEAATEALRRAPDMPDIRALWERRVTVHAMYWPAVYFDAMDNGDALEELVAELEQLGTCGTPRPVTDDVVHRIRDNKYDGLIASVSMPITDTSAFHGVIAAEGFEALVARALDWACVVNRVYIAPGKVVPLDSRREVAA